MATHDLVPKLRATAAAAATAVLVGCASGQSVAPEASINRNQVRTVQLRHEVLFAGRGVRIDRAARRELDAFLTRARVGHGDRVVVSAGTVGAGTGPRRLAQRRRQQVARHMRRRALSVAYANHAAARLGGDAISVRVRRSVVVAPDCPDWDAAMTGAALDGQPNRFGCLNASALASMVADPSDLVRGRRLEPGDGTYLSRGVRQYRAGKAKKPVSSQTK